MGICPWLTGCPETAANPYATVLGSKESASQRINFAQSFNGLGWILGPLIGGLLIFGATRSTGSGKFVSGSKNQS
jgi:MFS transporter, FHS family, L-fucose permease